MDKKDIDISNEPSAKRPYIEGGGSTRVVYIARLPNDMTEPEIATLGIPFGRMSSLLISRKKQNAFLEMEEFASAQRMAAHYGRFPPPIHGANLFISLSSYSDFKVEHMNTAAKTALEAASAQAETFIHNQPPPVLHVLVDNVQSGNEINLDILNVVFSKCGTVQRIVTFTGKDAKLILNGQNIYDNCCALRIDFSKNATLDVRYNSDRQRDYTRDLPSGPPGQVAGMKRPAGGSGGGDMSMQMSTMPPSAGLLQGGAPMQMQMQLPLGQMPIQVPGAGPPPQQGPHGIMGQGPMHGSNSGSARGGRNDSSEQPSKVILSVGVTTEKLSPDDLFSLFGVYGDVHRIKLLFNKPDSAFVQFATVDHAQRAIQNLSGKQLFGRRLRVFYSRLQEIQMNSGAQNEKSSEAHTVKDYTNSKQHRFRNPNPRTLNNIFPPNTNLHISNLLPNSKEEDVRALFAQFGFEARAIRFLGEQKNMAIVTMPTVEDAVLALVKLHNYKQAGEGPRGGYLRVSFARPANEQQPGRQPSAEALPQSN